MIIEIFKGFYTLFLLPVLNGAMFDTPDQYMYLWFCYLSILIFAMTWFVDFAIRVHLFRNLYKFTIRYMQNKRRVQEQQLQRKKERALAQANYYKTMDELLAIVDAKGR